MASRTNTTYTTDNTIHDTNNIYNNNATHCVSSSGQEPQRVALQLPSWFVVQLTVTASLGGCLFGYDMGAISGTLPQLANTFDLDDRQKELSECICTLYHYVSRLVVLTDLPSSVLNCMRFRNHRLTFCFYACITFLL
jgi:hypothetical protein